MVSPVPWAGSPVWCRHWEWIPRWGRSHWITCHFLKTKETSAGELGLRGGAARRRPPLPVFSNVSCFERSYLLSTRGGFSHIRCAGLVLQFHSAWALGGHVPLGCLEPYVSVRSAEVGGVGLLHTPDSQPLFPFSFSGQCPNCWKCADFHVCS